MWSWRHGAMLNYGDAVAHLHIARRVFDSHRPGLSQLGSVWLPLPHLLMIPFVAVYRWWANGIAGMIPSALAYIAGCAGIYRLARHWLPPSAAVVALAFFALNPNLLYLQTTAMTEPLFLCEMIWTGGLAGGVARGIWIQRSAAQPRALLWLHRAGARCRRLHALRRLDPGVSRMDCHRHTLQLRRSTLRSRSILDRERALSSRRPWSGSPITRWSLATGSTSRAAPTPPQAIEMRTASPGSGPPHPGWHDPWVSLLFFMKCAEMDARREVVGQLACSRSAVLGHSVGLAHNASARASSGPCSCGCRFPSTRIPLHYGSVPIFLPVWWPHSWYNTRYGMECCPPSRLAWVSSRNSCSPCARRIQAQLRVDSLQRRSLCLVAVNAGRCCANIPSPTSKAPRTSNPDARSKSRFRRYCASLLARQRPERLVLMKTSVYPESRRVHRNSAAPDHQRERQGISTPLRWQRPHTHAAIVLAFDGDEIDQAVKAHPEGLDTGRPIQRAADQAPARFTSPIPRPVRQAADAVIASGKVTAI